MAEPTVDWIKANYKGYAGWSDPASILADFRATGGAGKDPVNQSSGQSSGASYSMPQIQTPDWQSMLKQATEMYQQAVQPQIQALQAGTSNIESRYQQLLGDITKKTYEAKQAEYSRRGIPLSSGAYETDIARTTAPLVQQAGQVRSDEMTNLQNTIAQLQSGALQGGISTGTNLYNSALGQYNNAAQLALQLQQMQQQANQPQVLSSGQTLYDPNTGQAIYTVPSSASSGGSDYSWLGQLFGGGLTSGNQNTAVQYQEPPYSPAQAGIKEEYPKGSGIIWVSDGMGGWT